MQSIFKICIQQKQQQNDTNPQNSYTKFSQNAYAHTSTRRHSTRTMKSARETEQVFANQRMLLRVEEGEEDEKKIENDDDDDDDDVIGDGT